MQSGTLKYYNISEESDGRVPSDAQSQDDYRYSGDSGYESQDFDHTSEDLYTIEEMASEEEEAEKLYAQLSENEIPSVEEQESAGKVDWIDQSLQQISNMRSTLLEQHNFNRAKRVELDAISAALKHACSLIPSSELTLCLEEKFDQMSKDKSDGVTATSQDQNILPRLMNSHHSEESYRRTPDPKVGLPNSPPSDTHIRSDPTSLCTSYRARTTSKYSFPRLPSISIENPSRSSLPLSPTQSEANKLEINSAASPLVHLQQTKADENWPLATYACSSDTSARSETGMSTDTMVRLLSNNDLRSDAQRIPSFDLSLHSTVETATDDQGLDVGWDELEDIMSQLGTAGPIPSATWLRPSRSRWPRRKASQVEHEQPKKAQYNHNTSLKLRFARLC